MDIEKQERDKAAHWRSAEADLVVIWRELQLKRLFLAAFIVGGLIIFVGGLFRLTISGSIFFGVLPVLLIMAGYWLIGGRTEDADRHREAFADSLYYLGFLFTLASLLAALLSLRAEDPNLGELAARFGLALSTTIVGLGGRVYLVSFERGPEEEQRAAEQALATAVERFQRQVELVSDKFEFVLKDLADKTHEIGKDVVSAVAAHLEQFSEEINERQGQIRKQSLETLEQTSGKFRQTAEFFEQSAQAILQEIDDSLQRATTKATDAFETFHAIPKQYEKSAKENLALLQSVQGNLAGAIRDSAEQLTTVLDEIAGLKEAISILSDEAKRGADRLATLASRSVGVAGTTDSLTKAGKALIDCQQAAEQLVGQMSKVGEEASSVAAALEKALADLQNLVGGSSDAIGQVRDNLIAATDAIRQHLNS